jgi:hypothetical protein
MPPRQCCNNSGSDGIGYATYSQVADQQTVRVVPIEGLTPEAANYPFQRSLYYVYKTPMIPLCKPFWALPCLPKGSRQSPLRSQINRVLPPGRPWVQRLVVLNFYGLGCHGLGG